MRRLNLRGEGAFLRSKVCSKQARPWRSCPRSSGGRRLTSRGKSCPESALRGRRGLGRPSCDVVDAFCKAENAFLVSDKREPFDLATCARPRAASTLTSRAGSPAFSFCGRRRHSRAKQSARRTPPSSVPAPRPRSTQAFSGDGARVSQFKAAPRRQGGGPASVSKAGGPGLGSSLARALRCVSARSESFLFNSLYFPRVSKSVLLLESKFGLMGAFVTSRATTRARRPTCWPQDVAPVGAARQEDSLLELQMQLGSLHGFARRRTSKLAGRAATQLNANSKSSPSR